MLLGGTYELEVTVDGETTTLEVAIGGSLAQCLDVGVFAYDRPCRAV